MTPAFDPDELGLQTPPEERAELAVLARRLEADRPVPAPAFRGDLLRTLLARGPAAPRPRRLRLLIAGYACSGLVLLVLGASSVAGLGPLAA